MSEQSRAAEWRTPPQRNVISDEDLALEHYAERFNFICYLGCGAGAFACLAAAAIAWADPIARFFHL